MCPSLTPVSNSRPQRLVTEALARGSRDNLTALVAVLPFSGAKAGAAERVFLAGRPAPLQGGRKAPAAPPALSADELADTY